MWFNPIIKLILRSPFHGLLSSNMLLVSYTGRKSGRAYTIPVNYVRAGDCQYTVSFTGRNWWRNLRGGAAVSLRLKGRDLPAVADVIAEPEEAVTASLMYYFHLVPNYTRYMGVGLDSGGQPNREDVARAARERVMVQFRL
jgi:deazaflavin-dependent oxidoreductase (nitroreductase family)